MNKIKYYIDYARITRIPIKINDHYTETEIHIEVGYVNQMGFMEPKRKNELTGMCKNSMLFDSYEEAKQWIVDNAELYDVDDHCEICPATDEAYNDMHEDEKHSFYKDHYRPDRWPIVSYTDLKRLRKQQKNASI